MDFNFEYVIRSVSQTVFGIRTLGIPNKRVRVPNRRGRPADMDVRLNGWDEMLGFRAVRSESGGKAWFGGLASSGLAGYRACERGNVSIEHFYPLSFCVGAIIPRVTDKLLQVADGRDLLYFRSDFLSDLSKSSGDYFIVFIIGICCNLMIIKASCCQNQKFFLFLV